MSTEESKAIVLRYYYATHNQHDLSVIEELCEREYGEGRRRFFEMAYAALPDLQSTVEDVIAQDDKVVIREVVRGTHRGEFRTPLGPIAPTGKQIAISSVLIYRVEKGKIVQEWAQVDWLRGLQQVGVMPAPAAG